LAFDPKDFYDLARWLVTQSHDESKLRTAISRVYYAAHHIALERLVQKNWMTPSGTGNDHGAVIRELRNRRTRQLADNLSKLLELRQHADYHLDATLSARNASCSLCKQIRESVTPHSDPVNKAHWDEVATVSGRCIPLLEKL
jgi:uncharacterized protein (UPF0332 family)